ncbi:MAG: TetR family transcriptional regulator [Candidatus Binatia bacterium]|nr:MAG: TetR family transcriptional regulator [Candidatus Binatia bacterium]
MPEQASPSREDSRRDLLNVAIDCFAKYGYAATSIDRIAKAAGVTKGALYYHFKDKEELLFESVKHRLGQFERRVVQEIAPVADPADSIRALGRICHDHATKSNHRRLIVTLLVEALDTYPALDRLFRDMMRRFRGFIAGLVDRGKAGGRFRAEVDSQLAASIFAGSVMGLEIQYYQDPAGFDLRRALEANSEQFIAWLSAPHPRAKRSKRGGL